MFYDFNRHKRLPAEAKKPQASPALGAMVQKHLANVPENIKIPVLILLISLSGLGFLRLTIDAVTGESVSLSAPAVDIQSFPLAKPKAFAMYLDSLKRAYSNDSLSQFSLKR